MVGGGFEGVNCGDGILAMWVSSPSCCSCSLCGSFEREFVTVPCGCGHGHTEEERKCFYFLLQFG